MKFFSSLCIQGMKLFFFDVFIVAIFFKHNALKQTKVFFLQYSSKLT